MDKNIKDNILNLAKKNSKLVELVSEYDYYNTELTDETLFIKFDENNITFSNENYLRNNCKSFESFRIIPILANGGVIFSEHSNIKDEDEYKDYNIIFVEKNNILNAFENYIKNINYDLILEKVLNYRKNMKTNNNIDNFLNFHNII